MFTIVTHHTPDLDAICAVWLIKHFLPNWQNAKVKFVAAGKTLNNQIVDSDPHVLHVDTGFGILDHHQTSEDTCAAKKAYQFIKKEINSGIDSRLRGNDNSKEWQDEALERMYDVVNFFDHFGEAKLTDANADYHIFDTVAVIDGLKQLYPDDDHKILEAGSLMLDAIYKMMQEKVWAEEIMEKEGVPFKTKWGKGIAFETLNDGVLKLAQKSGFVVAVRKDPTKGYVRIKGTPGTRVDFSQAYELLKQKDPKATWYLHASKKILLNGTTKNPDMRPTKLTLNEIIEVLRN